MSAEVAAVWCCSSCGAVYHKDYPRCPNDGAEVVLAVRDPLLDQPIGNYVIDRLIGEGGMGRVYMAHHATLSSKRYAIKVLLGDAAATASMRKRFTHEAESASRLDHPNLVNVLDFGQMATGLPYIVMEYVDGTVLTDLMIKPMDPARVVRIARAVCDGLVHAHEAGVVHRDLKPDNIMIVTVDGVEIPRVADFGLATTVDAADARLTSSGTAMGTPAYAAPEQLAGRQVDARADLYSLGMTMFEMLTGGTLPFEGHIMETMTAKAHREAPPLSTIAPTLVLPAGLEALVTKLVRRLRVDRPENAREVIAELDEIALGVAINERDPTIVEPAHVKPVEIEVRTERVRSKRHLAAWLFAAVAVMATAAGGWWWYGQRTVIVPTPIAVAAQRPTPVPSAPPATPPPAATSPPLAVASNDAAPKPETSMPTTPAPVARDKRRHKEHVKHEPKVASAIAVPVPDEIPPPPVPVPVPVPAPIVEPPVAKPPTTIATVIGNVAVRGSLSEATVHRALERITPAIRQCAPASPQTIQVHFSIGESRRATNVQASGAPTSGCVAAAFGGMRSETAPDVGDADVDVQIAYVAR